MALGAYLFIETIFSNYIQGFYPYGGSDVLYAIVVSAVTVASTMILGSLLMDYIEGRTDSYIIRLARVGILGLVLLFTISDAHAMTCLPLLDIVVGSTLFASLRVIACVRARDCFYFACVVFSASSSTMVALTFVYSFSGPSAIVTVCQALVTILLVLCAIIIIPKKDITNTDQ